MNIKILNEQELQFNSELFKLGDNVVIETNRTDADGKGKLFCLHPSLNMISIEYKNGEKIEAKPFLLKDIINIRKHICCIDKGSVLIEINVTVESVEKLNEITQDIHTILSECAIENSLSIKNKKFCEGKLLSQIDVNVTVESVERAKEIAHDLHETLNEAYNAENTIKVADTIFSLD